ncbi:MAG: hypothetical protein DWQ10_06915, partial [Calditrichaeota bacterium]
GDKTYVKGKLGIGTTNPSVELHVDGRFFASQGGIITQEDWSNVPAASSNKNDRFQNSWENYSNTFNQAAYFKDSMGIVHLRGLVKKGTIGTHIFILPNGYRPPKRELMVACTHPNIAGRVDIWNDGKVVAQGGSNLWISLDGITFKAAPAGPVFELPPGGLGGIGGIGGIIGGNVVVNPRG